MSINNRSGPPFFDIFTELSAARILIAEEGVKPGSVNRAELLEAIAKESKSSRTSPGGAHGGLPEVRLIVPVALDKGRRLRVLNSKQDTVKNSISNIR